MPVEVELAVEADRFTLYLSRRVQQAEDVITFEFDCPVFVPGTRFAGTVFERTTMETGQQIVSGDASSELETNDLSVSWQLKGELLGTISVIPDRFTPNGDGVNDAASISYGVLQLLEDARVSVQIYDLCGQLVWEARERRSSGLGSVVWRGMDRSGERVVPGIYVYRISVDAAVGEDRRTGLIGVAY